MPPTERKHLQTFTIIPVLGRKTDVPPDDPSLFESAGEGVALTHDVGGVNFDLVRKTNACTKSKGYAVLDSAANSQASRTMGLFELESANVRDHIMFDNGKAFIFNRLANDNTWDLTEDVNSTTFANSEEQLYSIIRVGAYMVFSDFGQHQAYKWQHNEGYLTPLIASGTVYRARYLMVFQRRVIFMYTDQANGDIDVRWSSPWPATAIINLTVSDSNQLYIPNDDTIAGGATLGHDNAYVYCKNSIQQLIYYPDYATPFRLVTIVPQQGCTGHHSIVNMGDRHFVFNRNFGFCMWNGATSFPTQIISKDIDADVRGITKDYYDRIYGTYIPLTRQAVWAVPMDGASSNTHLWFYNIDTGQWTIEDKPMRCIDSWRIYDSLTWVQLQSIYAPSAGLWSEITGRWPDYQPLKEYPVYSNTNGRVYKHTGEDLADSALDGYRIEPIGDFGNKLRRDQLKEIWFNLNAVGAFNIHVYHRSGDTCGEVEDANWTTLDTIDCDSPTNAYINVNKTGRLHQIKWRTNSKDEKFQVNSIIFKYLPERIH